jgi:hypothetical protein
MISMQMNQSQPKNRFHDFFIERKVFIPLADFVTGRSKRFSSIVDEHEFFFQDDSVCRTLIILKVRLRPMWSMLFN